MGRKPKDTKYLFLRGGRWWIKYNRGSTHIVKTTGFKENELKAAQDKRDEELRPHLLENEVEKKAEAVKNLMTAEERLETVKDALPAMTLGEAWDAFKITPKGKTPRGRVIEPGSRTLADYEGRWNAFCKWMEKTYPKKDEKGDKIPWELRQIGKEHAQRYIAEIGAGRSANTRNKTLTFLRLVFKVLAEKARIKANPFDGMDAAPLAVSRKRPLTLAELAQIAKNLDGKGEMERLFSLGYYTGARLGDCVLMRWDCIDLEGRKIRYTPHKTAKGNREITLAIAPALFTLLETTPKAGRRGLVLPELGALYQKDPSAVSKRVQQVFTDTGIETDLEVKGYGKKVARVGFHSLRHAHITALLEGGVPMDMVRQQAGHSTIGMTAHYYHASEKALQAATQALPPISGTAGADAAGVAGKFLEQIEALSDSDLKRVAHAVGKVMKTRGLV